jgi:hypothetical protein
MKIRNLAGSLLSLLLLFGTGAVRAQPELNLTLTNPDRVVTQGTTTVQFDATILNPSTTDAIYLNGDSAVTSSPLLTVDDSPFFANAPLSLDPGASSGPFELFAVNLASDIPAGTYSLNTFSILGGPDNGTFSDFSDIADAGFSITVTPGTASVPEPATLPLLSAGLAGLLLARRRRASNGRQGTRSMPS